MASSFVIFDFDGTLVDSAPSVLHGLTYAFKQNGLTPLFSPDKSLIRPPLPKIIQLLAGEISETKFNSLLNSFKIIHDSESFLATRAYSGISDVLLVLRSLDVKLWIATNKRQHPTQLILKELGWEDWFDGVYCLDQFPEYQNKNFMIEKLISDSCLNNTKGCVVGDTDGDAHAAAYNNLTFLHAQWGYQKDMMPRINLVGCESPQSLLASILDTLELSPI